jgi:putative hydrolase of the HAD superfamily
VSFDPNRVDCWIFDLDYTLYPPACGLFGQIDQRMGLFIANLLGCDATEARRVQKMYFHDHGTTLAGLMHYHAIDPREFLDFVHDVDMSVLAAAPRLAGQINALPGRRLIFTNGDRPYAEKVLQALGLDGCFEGMWDVIAMDYKPKPEPSAYRSLIEAFGFDPERAVFVEDSARNLPPAKALGMQTVWLDCASEWGDRAKDDAAIDLVIDDLPQWLELVCAELAGSAALR